MRPKWRSATGRRELPALVDFLFLEDAPIDEASWLKAIAGDAVASEILAAALAAYAECAWDKDTLHAVTLEIAETAGRKLGKAHEDTLGVTSYLKLQGSADAPGAAHHGMYLKGGLVHGMSPEFIDTVSGCIESAKLPSSRRAS